MERTQEEKLIGGLTHIAVLFSWYGLIANIVLYILYRPKSQFASRQVKQALGLQVVVIIAGYLLSALFGISFLGLGAGTPLAAAIKLAALGYLVVGLFWLGVFALATLAAVKGFRGKDHRYLVIGEFVERLAE